MWVSEKKMGVLTSQNLQRLRTLPKFSLVSTALVKGDLRTVATPTLFARHNELPGSDWNPSPHTLRFVGDHVTRNHTRITIWFREAHSRADTGVDKEFDHGTLKPVLFTGHIRFRGLDTLLASPWAHRLVFQQVPGNTATHCPVAPVAKNIFPEKNALAENTIGIGRESSFYNLSAVMWLLCLAQFETAQRQKTKRKNFCDML